jgi:hypothetical protein
MAAQQAARKESRSKRDKPKDEVTQYEQELAGYLQERIKPGLNRGSIPLLARSIAKEIARQQRPDGASEDSDQDESSAEADLEPSDEAEDDHEEQPSDEAEDEASDEAEDEASDKAEEDLEDEPSDEAEDADDDVSEESEEPDFEADMRELQAELGDDWIVQFSVQGDEAWLTAEKDDGSQHVEGQTADLLREAVELLEEGGGRSG